MANNKIIIDILANVGGFLRGIAPIQQSVQSLSNSASSATHSVNQLNSAVTTYANSASSAASASKSFFGSISPEKLASASAALDRLSEATSRVFPRKGKGLYIPGLTEFGGAMSDILDPGKVATAAGYRLAYGIADIPIKAIQQAKQKINTEIQGAAQLEGTMFDLEAYLGGPDAMNFKAYTGIQDQTAATAKSLQDIQNKILSVGQSTSFTANEIAEALVTASKAGVTMEEIFSKNGKGGALEAISLLAQNTGEPLAKMAEVSSKLQEMFQTNLSKSQVAFGQAIDPASQYLMVVNSLSQADASSAASASQLTEALFNVGGSANNINMSFFDTVSLVSAMVPAFESAASAGTSLKYVFSRLTGANSVKAQENMKAYGLMDQDGQSVFFDEKGFKGLDFMVRKLRATFGDQTGMAVDMRNKIITEIFGQDALKAVSRMISMDDKQVEDMLKMAGEMSENARQGIDYAQKTADIKNEGLEFDLEYLSGSLDSLGKTLTMPLMKPFSNAVQSISGFANGMFSILTGASKNSPQVQEAYDELVKKSIIPNASGLFWQAMEYAETLKVGLDAITKEGFTSHSLAVALASLIGTSTVDMNVRVAEFQAFFKDMYKAIGDFVANLPGYLTWIRDNVGKAFDGLISAYRWIKDNWASIVFGLKAILAIMIADSVIQATNNWIEFGSAVAGALKTVKDFEGVRAVIATIRGPSALANAAGAAPTAASMVGTAASYAAGPAGLVGAASRTAAATATAAPVASAAKNWNTWTNVGLALQSAWTAASLAFRNSVGYITGLTTALGRFVAGGNLIPWVINGIRVAIGALTSPLGVLLVAIAGMTIAWQYNTGKIQEWTKSRFGTMYEYILQTWDLISTSFTQASVFLMDVWNQLTTWFASEGGANFLMGFSNMLKGVVQIIESLLLTFGGALKVVVGLLTLNGDLIRSGFQDLAQAFFSLLGGLLNALVGAAQVAVNTVAGILNWLAEKAGLEAFIPQDKINSFFNGVSKNLEWNGVQAGMNFSKGLAKGINKSNGEVDAAAHGAANTVKNRVAHDLIISSPSMDMYYKGEMVGQGLADGIRSKQDEIDDAASDAAKSVTEAVQNNINKAYDISFGINEMTGRGKTSYFTQEQTSALIGTGSSQSAYTSFTKTMVPDKTTTTKSPTVLNQSDATQYYGWRDRLQKSFYWSSAELAYRKRFVIDVKQTVVDMDKVRSRLSQLATEGKINGMYLPEGYQPDYQVDEKGSYIVDKTGNKIRLAAGELTMSNDAIQRYDLNDAKTAYDILLRGAEKLATTEPMRIEAARGATSDVERYIRSTGGYSTTKTSYKGFQEDLNLKKYYVGGVLQYVDPEKLANYGETTTTTTTYRQKTDAELAAMQGPDYISLSQLPIGAMRGDFANLPLDQYSTAAYDVAKHVKQFQFGTGDKAIAQRGLTDMFKNKEIANQFANVGNRAATYLSMREGQLKPNEVTVFQQLLAQDRADKLAYMNAVQQAQQQIAQGGDANAIIAQLLASQQGQTQTFKEVFDVKIPKITDYTAQMGGAFDEFAKLGPQAFNEALSDAVNPANQSEAFRALTPEAQASLMKSVQDLPSQAMAFLGDAMADGTLDSSEFDTYMMYVGEDIKRMRDILMRGTPPTQEEIDAAYNPFIDGAAKVVKSDQITGVLGTALTGASKILFNSMGKDAWDAFINGWMTNEKGEKIRTGDLKIGDFLKFTPENLREAGIPTGGFITEGILKGIQQGLITEDEIITKVFGPNGELIKIIRTAAKIKSPSEVFRDEVGVNLGLGVADGLKMDVVKNKFAENILSLLNSTNGEDYMLLIMNQASLFGQHIGVNMANGIYSSLMGLGEDKTMSLGEQMIKVYDDTRAKYNGKLEQSYKAFGTWIGLGVAQGITDSKGFISDAMGRVLAESVPKHVSMVIDMHSPSQFYADVIGKPMVQGIAQGIEQNSSSVTDALNPILTNTSYRPDISGAAVGGMMRRSQATQVSSSVENNYNLSLATSYPGQTVQQQFEIMRAFKGRR